MGLIGLAVKGVIVAGVAVTHTRIRRRRRLRRRALEEEQASVPTGSEQDDVHEHSSAPRATSPAAVLQDNADTALMASPGSSSAHAEDDEGTFARSAATAPTITPAPPAATPPPAPAIAEVAIRAPPQVHYEYIGRQCFVLDPTTVFSSLIVDITLAIQSTNVRADVVDHVWRSFANDACSHYEQWLDVRNRVRSPEPPRTRRSFNELLEDVQVPSRRTPTSTSVMATPTASAPAETAAIAGKRSYADVTRGFIKNPEPPSQRARAEQVEASSPMRVDGRDQRDGDHEANDDGGREEPGGLHRGGLDADELRSPIVGETSPAPTAGESELRTPDKFLGEEPGSWELCVADGSVRSRRRAKRKARRRRSA